jgi:hypothetical protein
MSSTDLLQAQSPNQYGAWTNIELINEPAFLDEFGPQLNEPFDFSLDVNGQERQRVDSVTESLSSTTSTATDPKCEPAYLRLPGFMDQRADVPGPRQSYTSGQI